MSLTYSHPVADRLFKEVCREAARQTSTNQNFFCVPITLPSTHHVTLNRTTRTFLEVNRRNELSLIIASADNDILFEECFATIPIANLTKKSFREVIMHLTGLLNLLNFDESQQRFRLAPPGAPADFQDADMLVLHI